MASNNEYLPARQSQQKLCKRLEAFQRQIIRQRLANKRSIEKVSNANNTQLSDWIVDELNNIIQDAFPVDQG